MQKNLRERFTPLYFLSALGAGGLSVSFFLFSAEHNDSESVKKSHEGALAVPADVLGRVDFRFGNFIPGVTLESA